MMTTTAKKIAAVAALAVGITVVIGLVVGLVVAPQMARDEIESRIERVEARTGLGITFGELDTNLSGGATITDISVKDAAGDDVVTVGTASASIDLFKALFGEKAVSDLEANDIVVTLRRDASGSFPLVDQLRGARDANAGDDPDDSGDSGGSGGGILRYFGGEFPDVDVRNVRIDVVSAEGAPLFPLKSMTVANATVEGGDVATISSTASIESVESESWTLPTEVTFSATLDTTFAPNELDLELDRPIAVGGLAPYPFLRVGFSGFSVKPDLIAEVRGLRLGFEHTEEPFLTVKSSTVTLEEWTLDPRQVRVVDLTVDEPRLALSFDRLGASALTDLDHILRSPRARSVAATARSLTSEIAEKKSPPTEPAQPEEPIDPDEELADADPAPADDDPFGQDVEAEERNGLMSLLINRAPQHVAINAASVHVTDHRNLPVARPAKELMLSEASFEVTHRPDEKIFRTSGAFVASADGASRGRGEGRLDWAYGKRTIDAALDLDALDLSWAAQMLGPRVAKHVRGGTLRAKLEVTPGKGRAVKVDGNASVESLVFDWHRLAEEPLQDVTASYGFTALYNPDGKTPAAELLELPLFKDGYEPPEGIDKGSVVFTRGLAQLNGVRTEVRPAIYGTAALPLALPARVDLEVALPKTPVMDLFNAVPTALLGPLQGTKMAGSFGWDFKVEIPLHRAGDMEWETVPKLEAFELLAIPDEVDVRKLETGMQLTITDELSEEEVFERTVKLPPMKPLPAAWLLENSELELEKIDEVRRRREWPVVPEYPRQIGMLPEVVDSPQYWLTPHAEGRAAPRPWADGDVIERTEDQPYGPYVFVPLHHISKWMTRAILTTEDNSFFKHDGLNFFALKESVEDNIEAGRFRRGASTISMQLIKNVFLDRQKLIARKLREVFLVWLMEKVVDVPKPRILELYFNVIEFGPGIFGIHDAAVHYFGKRPSDLTLGEVSWLVSIIPNPKKYHFYWERGEITPSWFRRMSRYINVMHNRERATVEERDAALEAAPLFYKPNIEEDEPVLRVEETTFGEDLMNLFLDDDDASPYGGRGAADPSDGAGAGAGAGDGAGAEPAKAPPTQLDEPQLDNGY